MSDDARASLERRRDAAAQKRAENLEELGKVEARLGALPKSDPGRVSLKTRKQRLLEEVRAAKGIIKGCNRALSVMGPAPVARSVEAAPEIVEGVDLDRLHADLYAELTALYADLDEAPGEAVSDFLDYMDHKMGTGA